MEIYNTGQHKLDDFDFTFLERKYVWFAYYYETNGVYGEGQAVGKSTKGELHLFSLCHHSFAGPLENDYSLFDLDSDNVLDEDINRPELRKKIEELINI